MKLGELAGGFFTVADHESAEAMKKRLLTAEASKLRVILLDNVKSPRFSWPDLEALVTTSVISGHKMYAGESSRPNYLTWMITLNGPSLSTDMAQRVITIKVDRPPKGSKNDEWVKNCDDYIRNHGDAIRADVAALFQRDLGVI